MPLDFEKLKQASHDDLVTLGLCELSRMVDAFERLAAALERIAPEPGVVLEEAAEPVCPHPIEARRNHTRMGQPEWSNYICTICNQHIVNGVAAS